MNEKPRLLILGCLVVLGLCAGCSSEFCRVKGQIVRNGAPAKPKGGLYYQVSFFPLDQKGQLLPDGYPANKGSEGHRFVVPGKTGKGIPPGTYRIGIRMTDHEGKRDDFNGSFGEDNSPITKEISSSGEITIDLAEYAGPKS